jgi:hypothetical protein
MARSRSYDFRKSVEQIVDKRTMPRPTTAIIYSLDGNKANLRIGNSPALIRNVDIIGDPALVSPGDEVQIVWSGERPFVLAGGGGIPNSTNVKVVTDNRTIENSSSGLRVKRGGIGVEHLNFVPLTEGQGTQDPLTKGGWIVTDNGVIFNNKTFLSPDGTITLGSSPDIIRLSTEHSTWRLWAGNSTPEQSPFAVDKYGAIKATSGEIGGWSLSDTAIISDTGNAELNSATPHIQLGGATYATGAGFWVGKDVDSVYKLRVGSTTKFLQWDGEDLVVSGEIRIGATDYATGTGFWVGDDSGTYKLRIGSDTQYLKWDGSQLLLTGNIAIGATGYMTGEGFWAGLDGGIPKLFIGDDTNYIIFDGEALSISGVLQSTNFLEGVSGWHLDPSGSAEFSDVTVRGSIKSSVIEYEQVMAVDGGFIVTKAANVVRDDFTADSDGFNINLRVPDGVSPSDVGNYYEATDIVRVKSGLTGFWGTVVSATNNLSHWTINVTKNTPSEDVSVMAGSTLINYGQSGSGAIEMLGKAPMLRMYTHTGTPWASYDDFLIIGQLEGKFGFSASELGFGVGDPTRIGNYFVATEDGITMQGEIRNGATSYTVGTGFWVGKDSDVFKLRIGDPTNSYLTWDGSSLNIRGNIVITSGSGLENFDNVGDYAFRNDVDWADVTGINMPEDNATVGADWESNLSGIPNTLQDESAVAGLHLTSQYMGYHDGTQWVTYIENTGMFYFKGSGAAYIAWDPSENMLYGHDGTSVQWYADSDDGKFYAGEGSVILDDLGIQLKGNRTSFFFVDDSLSMLGSLKAESDSIKLTAGMDTSGSNLITNSTFETNTTGWTLAGDSPVPVRSSTRSYAGTYSLKFEPHTLTWDGMVTEAGDPITTETGDPITVVSSLTTKANTATYDYITLVAGSTYAFSAQVYHPNQSWFDFTIDALFYDSSYTLVRTRSIDVSGLTLDTWSAINANLVVNVGESYLKIRFSLDQGYGGDSDTPDGLYIDNVTLYNRGGYNSQVLLGNGYVEVGGYLSLLNDLKFAGSYITTIQESATAARTLTLPDKTGTLATLDDISAGTGDVVGPASHYDNAIPRWDGVDSKTLQGSNFLIDDNDIVTMQGKDFQFIPGVNISSDAIIALGSIWNGSAWVAKHSYAQAMYIGYGDFYWYGDSGLTPESTFTPTNIMTLNDNGNLTVLGDLSAGNIKSTPTANAIPKADVNGKLDSWITSSSGGTDLGWFNVKDATYGASGNGSDDDQPEIQAAINAAEAAGGGVVYFPPGTYMIGSTLTIDSSGVILMGAGIGTSQNYFGGGTAVGVSEIKARTGFSTSTALILVSARTDGVGIQNIMLNGNGLAEFIIDAQNMCNSYFENILGVQWNGTAGSYGLRIRNDSSTYPTRGTVNQTWVNCHFVRPSTSSTYGSGLDLNPTNSTCCEIKFIGCVFTAYNRSYSSSGGHVVRFGQCDHISFVGCLFQHHEEPATHTAAVSGFTAFYVRPVTSYAFPNNITFTNSPHYGGVYNSGTWSNSTQAALLFYPYMSGDSQPVPPTSATGGTLPLGLCGGVTDKGLGLGFPAPWMTLSYGTDWLSYSADFYPLGYMRDIAGIVHVRGSVKRPTGTGALIGTLPTKYRPTKNCVFPINASWAIGAIRITASTGAIDLISGSPTTIVTLDGISFPAEQ